MNNKKIVIYKYSILVKLNLNYNDKFNKIQIYSDIKSIKTYDSKYKIK